MENFKSSEPKRTSGGVDRSVKLDQKVMKQCNSAYHELCAYSEEGLQLAIVANQWTSETISQFVGWLEGKQASKWCDSRMAWVKLTGSVPATNPSKRATPCVGKLVAKFLSFRKEYRTKALRNYRIPTQEEVDASVPVFDFKSNAALSLEALGWDSDDDDSDGGADWRFGDNVEEGSVTVPAVDPAPTTVVAKKEADVAPPVSVPVPGHGTNVPNIPSQLNRLYSEGVDNSECLKPSEVLDEFLRIPRYKPKPIPLPQSRVPYRDCWQERSFVVEPRKNDLVGLLWIVFCQITLTTFVFAALRTFAFGQLDALYFVHAVTSLSWCVYRVLAYSVCLDFFVGVVTASLKFMHYYLKHDYFDYVDEAFESFVALYVPQLHPFLTPLSWKITCVLAIIEYFATMAEFFCTRLICSTITRLDMCFNRFFPYLSVNDVRLKHTFTDKGKFKFCGGTSRYLSHNASAVVLKMDVHKWERSSCLVLKIGAIEIPIFTRTQCFSGDASVYNELIDFRAKIGTEYKAAADYVSIKYGRSSCFEKYNDWQVGDDPSRGGFVIAHAMALNLVQANQKDLVNF